MGEQKRTEVLKMATALEQLDFYRNKAFHYAGDLAIHVAANGPIDESLRTSIFEKLYNKQFKNLGEFFESVMAATGERLAELEKLSADVLQETAPAAPIDPQTSTFVPDDSEPGTKAGWDDASVPPTMGTGTNQDG